MEARWRVFFAPDDALDWQGSMLPGIRNPRRLIGFTLLAVGILITELSLRGIFVLGHALLGLFFMCIGMFFLIVGYGLTFCQRPLAAAAHRTFADGITLDSDHEKVSTQAGFQGVADRQATCTHLIPLQHGATA